MQLLILITLSLYLTQSHQKYDWSTVESTVNSYLMEGAYNGGILRVSNGTHTIFNYPFGHHSHN